MAAVQIELDRQDIINTFLSMDKTHFETRAVSIFNDWKYVFHDELQQGEVLKKMSFSERAALLTVGALAGC